MPDEVLFFPYLVTLPPEPDKQSEQLELLWKEFASFRVFSSFVEPLGSGSEPYMVRLRRSFRQIGRSAYSYDHASAWVTRLLTDQLITAVR